MQPIRNGRDQRFEEDNRGGTIGLLMQLDESELRRSIDSNKQIELAFLRPDFGDVDMKEADRIGLELFLRFFVTFDIRQTADAMAMQAAMQ